MPVVRHPGLARWGDLGSASGQGQILVLQRDADSPLLERNVRPLTRGWSAYLVPRADGGVIVAATVEECGFDTSTTAEGARTLLRGAHLACPEGGQRDPAQLFEDVPAH